jgi:hypothetical protein
LNWHEYLLIYCAHLIWSAVTDLTRQGYYPGRVVSEKGEITTSLLTNSNALVASEVQWKETE